MKTYKWPKKREAQLLYRWVLEGIWGGAISVLMPSDCIFYPVVSRLP